PKLSVTVSPGSRVPLTEPGVSLISAEPEATINGASGCTFTMTFVESSAWLKRKNESTARKLAMAPWVEAVATRVTVALLVAAKSSNSHSKIPPANEQLPWELAAETNVRPAPNLFVNLTDA